MGNKIEKTMEILEDERMKELECAMHTKELLRKTINPFKRMELRKSCETFMSHSVGIELAILRIKREFWS